MSYSDWQNNRRIKVFGTKGPTVIVLHGGPAAFGGADQLAEDLSNQFRTYSPWQRRSGGVPVTVDCHVEDLRQFMEVSKFAVKPALIGEA